MCKIFYKKLFHERKRYGCILHELLIYTCFSHYKIAGSSGLYLDVAVVALGTSTHDKNSTINREFS